MGKDLSYLKHVVKADPALRACLPSTRGQPNPFILIGANDNGKVEERKAETQRRREEER